ncbi:hypothetical protein [Pseudooceanicola aestuarii]|uniref:hypothetical protein n=1 Tax=Pseudooceanicola aestuarii TaxID=2697319 RepID=UPI0013D5F500|nr:hypothetical protein [Pseudooceanicola aestuarii]
MRGSWDGMLARAGMRILAVAGITAGLVLVPLSGLQPGPLALSAGVLTTGLILAVGGWGALPPR